MAFDFKNLTDSVTKSVTKFGQEASLKTKNLTESVRINNAIGDQNKVIQKAYEDLGRKYYEDHARAGDGQYLDIMQTITQSMDVIEGLKKQLSEIKGETQCPNCGAMMEKDAVFCVKCGYKMPEMVEEPIETMGKEVCPCCGETVQPGTVFCTKCGAKIQTSQPQPVVEQPCCPSCGQPIEANSVFCTQCGAKIG